MTSRTLPFDPAEYDARLEGLRELMAVHGLEVCVLTSAHNTAYYAGVLGAHNALPHAVIVTNSQSVTVAANGFAWRPSHGEAARYDDTQRDNFWRTVAQVVGTGRVIGCEADHLTLLQSEKLNHFVAPLRGVDIARGTMEQRLIKSQAELDLIRHAAAVADIGGHAMRDAAETGGQARDIAVAGRAAMELEIARRFPDADYSGTHAQVLSAMPGGPKIQQGDMLPLHACPMISGYPAALTRTMFLGTPPDASRRIWDANIAAQAHGISLLQLGVPCAEVATKRNAFLDEHQLLHLGSGSYGHALEIAGGAQTDDRQGGLNLRTDNETVLEPGMVLSVQSTLAVPDARHSIYAARDIVLITDDGPQIITQDPFGGALRRT